MRERLNNGIFFGFVGNLLFLGFALVCMIYHVTFDPKSAVTEIIGAIAYIVEFAGFFTLLFSAYLIWGSARDRKLMKTGYTAYIFFEAFMMFIELNSHNFKSYNPYSQGLAIFHAILSALICYLFLQLDKDNKKFEHIIMACIALIFVGMLGNIIGIRIYFSILINAVAFSLFFGGVRYLLQRGEIDIDCHGDNPRPAEYKSDFFKD